MSNKILDKIKNYSEQDVGWNRAPHELNRWNCLLWNDCEQWCLLQSQKEKIHLNKLWEYANHRASRENDGSLSEKPYIEHAWRVFLIYKQISEIII